MKQALRSLIIAAAWTPSATALAQQSGALPRIRVLATGGTIAGAQASASNYRYQSGAYDVDSLLAAVPNLDKLAVITGEQIANIGSQDMNDEVWLMLGRRVNEVLASSDADGILITHGTDTLEETSYFLSLVTQERQARRHGRLDASGHCDQRRRTGQHLQRRGGPRRSRRAR